MGTSILVIFDASSYYRPSIVPKEYRSNHRSSMKMSNITRSSSPLRTSHPKIPFCVTMCGCDRCYNFSLVVDSTTCHLSTNVTEVSVRSYTTEKVRLNETAYFDLRLEGFDGVFATIISLNDTELLNTLKGIYLYSGVVYNLTLTLQYLNKTSAYALDAVQPRPMECRLKHIKEGDKVVVYLNQCNKPKSMPERRRWRSMFSNETKKSERDNLLHVKDSHMSYQKLSSDNDYFVCPMCPKEPLLQQCIQSKNVLLVGDSHMRQIWQSLEHQIPNLTNYGWMYRNDGYGIYKNIIYGPSGNEPQWGVPFEFKEGPMLRNLGNGFYRQLQEEHHFDVWVISSGHWDMRDITADEFVKHVEELFQEWARFQRSNGNHRLVWNGTPAYSYRYSKYGTLEYRTNVKIAVADERVKLLASKYNFTFVPYFDISFPFHKMSCDSHHYLHEKFASPIGSAQLNILLNGICQDTEYMRHVLA